MDEPTVAEGLMAVARAINNLGNADASTPMGGLEAHGVVIEEVGNQIESAGESISEAINNLASSMGKIAEAIRESKKE